MAHTEIPPLSHFTRGNESWTDEESREIQKEYAADKLDIIAIGVKHQRTPGQISYRLKGLGLVTHNTKARGYEEYRGSKLYEEITSSGKGWGKKDKKCLVDEETKPSDPRINIGKHWDEDEDEQLLVLAGSRVSIKDIADTHERSETAIISRLRLFAQKMHKEGKSQDEIVSATGLSRVQVRNAVGKIKNKPITNVVQTASSTNEMLYNMIKRLESRIEKLEKHIASLQ
jgi:hypothetical protein